MKSEDQDLQTIQIDIERVRPSYEIAESGDLPGFEETFTLIVRGSSALEILGADNFGLIHIRGSRTMESAALERIEEESMPGIGLVTSTKDGLVIQTILPLDAALKLSGCVESGTIGKVVAECDPIEVVGDQSALRSIRFIPA